MMNRIILIGNGFDLAHGLATSYTDFIRGYYTIQKLGLLKGEYELNDGLCAVKISGPEDRKTMQHFRWVLSNSMFQLTRNLGEITPQEQYNKFFNDNLTYKSKFFEAIDKAAESKNWVDIESEYYAWLKNIFRQCPCGYSTPDRLNEDLDLIKTYLTVHLSLVQEKIKPALVKDCIRETIYEPFDVRDISVGGQGLFEEFLAARLKSLSTDDKIDNFLRRFGQSSPDRHVDIMRYLGSVRSSSAPDSLDISKHLKKINDNEGDVPNCFLLPEQILLLNFNYTKMADLYIPEGSDFKVNHIHGELENDKNPIIFGYGDELDEDYKKISNLQDNSYLTNIKSIRYLETDNYRRLLRFIDSSPYQIYIMGHSCGNSDRTLLNTLFEHRNCVSIKPFYYLKEDGSDNYIEIIQNISRNFNNMQTMRDRVVNKSYCRPLVPREN